VLGRRSEPDDSRDRSDRTPLKGPCDKDRFEEIALPHLDSVYRLARSLTGAEAEADDLLQETFIRAYRAFSGFELREYGAKPWLFRILYNAFYTLKGRQRRQPALLGDVDLDQFAHGGGGQTDAAPTGGAMDGERVVDWDHVLDWERVADWEQFDEEIKSAVGQLQPEFRSVLWLVSVERLSYKEIAQVCDCALGTVMSRLYRARRLMAKQLGNYARTRRWPTKR